ncbi:MAG: polysaccharide biosynthesis tyrosine autokinase [Deltaproteobacteria bacterium]|nr:polysaccharide biosynthesis tyrosine autokinase [Candidatus Tharpella sp.]
MSINDDFDNIEIEDKGGYPLANPDPAARINPRNLPSTEVRELLPPLEEEIHLRDYIEVIVRRKWTVISLLLIIFSAVAIFTLTRTPLFMAKSVVKVSSQEAHLTSFAGLESQRFSYSIDFQKTQIQLMQSEQVAGRVIKVLNLAEDPVFSGKKVSGSNDEEVAEEEAGIFSQMMEMIAMVRDFIRFKDDKDEKPVLSAEAQARIRQNGLLGKFKGGLRVSQVPESELLEVSFSSPDAALAARIVNATLDEFINMQMDSRLELSKNASKFLALKIEESQIKLEASEKQLTVFSRRIGIVSLDPKSNMVMKQLEELNAALATARAVRLSKEAIYQQAISGDRSNLNQILNNMLIQELQQQHSILESEYEDLSTIFKPGHPKMRQLKARTDKLMGQIDKEKEKVVAAIKNDYETALKTQLYLEENAEEQKQRAINLGEKATQYKILAREVETNKSIYESLLQRAKEIEATVGATATNIQIIDAARIPLYPYKPRVSRNFMLGLIFGLIAGVGAAFMLEYMDNTIKNPDEMVFRYHIPILGLIPFVKGKNISFENMGLKYFNEPRIPLSESIRTAMTSIDLSASGSPPKSILVTSILPGAGKSTISSNIALSFLSSGKNCLLIDADLRKPSLHKVYHGVDRSKGLSSLLTGLEKLQDVIHKTDYEGLDFISSGPLPPNPAELVSSRRMRELLKVCCKYYDHVVIDSPPYQGFAELLVMANMVDGIILVAVEGDTPREGVSHFRKSLLNIGGNILGAIINKTGQKKGYSSYSGYKYYSYNYEYGNQKEIS